VENHWPAGWRNLSPLQQSLAVFLENVPALFWRLDIVKNEIVFLNEHAVAGLAESIPLVLKNVRHAREVVLEQDLDRFFTCLSQIRKQQPASVLVRITNDEGFFRWITILGMPDPERLSGYVGLLADCTDLMDAALASGRATSLEDKIALIATPVVLARFRDRRIVLANPMAQTLFGCDLTKDAGLALEDLLAPGSLEQLSTIFENLIFSGRWGGPLTIIDGQGEGHACEVRVRAYTREGENLLWFALTPLPSTGDGQEDVKGEESGHPSPELEAAFAACNDVRSLLRTLLANQPESGLAEAAMLSRIFISANRIEVTGEGAAFLLTPEGDTHPYEGSIAENIVRFDLDHVIVEDTSRSIKPIDWVLFIPRGIRSYYAKPFFEDGVLRNVLIFCSTETKRFSECNVRPYRVLFDLFESTLRRVLGSA
jgi:PAS domain-containing protein